MTRRCVSVVLLVLLVGLCADSAEAERGFYLASTGIQAFPGEALECRNTPANLSEDVDVTAISLNILGIPWDEFRLDQPLPPLWLQELDELAGQVATIGKPVFLQLSLGNGYLAGKTVVADGKLAIAPTWSVPCYDFLTARDGVELALAYLKYVIWVIQKFDPRWLNLSAEINLGQCDAAWDGIVEVVNASYIVAKKLKPTIVAFPSFQLAALYGEEPWNCPDGLVGDACFDRNYAKISRLKRDRFAIAAYPQIYYYAVSQIPADYFTRAAHRVPYAPERILIAETGWNSRPFRAMYDGMCTDPLFITTEAEQRAYFDRLTSEAQLHEFDLILWWYNRDLIVSDIMEECPCAFDPEWCGFLESCRGSFGSGPFAEFLGEFVAKGWGTLGIRDWWGVPKAPIYERWQFWRGQPIRQ